MPFRAFCCFAITFALCSPSLSQDKLAANSQHLKDYILRPDTNFRWELRDEGRVGRCEYARLHLVSQNWQGSQWKHVMYLLKPDSMKDDSRSALLLIAGGSWREEWGENGPEKLPLPGEATLISAIADGIQSPAAILMQVPNQPLLGDKFEDAIIAETFERFMKDEGDDWPLLMPMVKSAVKAMDAAQEFSKQKWNHPIENFTVTGASKRGWTTWLTSAVDKRCNALAPIVIDMLNMSEQMNHQVATWGSYSDEIADYTELHLHQALDTPRGRLLQCIVDPYKYRESLMQPKLLIFGTNDRYWPLDACNLYWQDLRGDKMLLYVPNNGHGIKDYGRVIGSVTALHRGANGTESLPKLKWDFTKNAAEKSMQLRASSDRAPDDFRIWTARSATRDFRDAKWESTPANAASEKEFNFSLPSPETGYVAIFGEFEFPYNPYPAFFSTNVRIISPE
jgi:PhoPQ-activated pathogenicity-related protein